MYIKDQIKLTIKADIPLYDTHRKENDYALYKEITDFIR
jgi:hypothetical protein